MHYELIIGENLDVMQSMEDKSVDLIYADPPFNTGRHWGDYDDRWGGDEAFMEFIRVRLQEMHRLLKPTGSLWLHCDQYMGHYIKVELDRMFGRKAFRNEVVWCYTGPTDNRTKQFPRKHDTIFWYARGKTWTFNKESIRIPYKNGRIGNTAYGAEKMSPEELQALLERGKLPESHWTDIEVVARLPSERIGYQTQKPVALLERIINATSNEGDLILDPFAGSGTTIEAAYNLKRNAIGIDKNPDTPAIARVDRLNANVKLL